MSQETSFLFIEDPVVNSSEVVRPLTWEKKDHKRHPHPHHKLQDFSNLYCQRPENI